MTDSTLIERLTPWMRELEADAIIENTAYQRELCAKRAASLREAITALSSSPANAEKDTATYDALQRLDVSSPPSLDLRKEEEEARVAAALTASPDVRALSAKWRRIESQHNEVGDQTNIGIAYAHRACANELDATLDALPSIPEQHAEALGRMQVAFSAEEQRADAAERRADDESLRVQHARKQGAADGFQQGWHAALTRLREGDTVESLSELVPTAPSIPDTRAWAQHKPECDSIQTKELWLPCSCGLDVALAGGQK